MDKVIRKIQIKRTSLLLSLPEEMLKNIGAVGGDYLLLEQKKDEIILKKINLNKGPV